MSCLYLLLLGFLLAVPNNATPAATCGKGYGVSQGKCVDENECEYENPICGENAVCYNTVGSYYCQCETGYQTESKTVNFTQDESGGCEDINECMESKTICGPNAMCSNIPGSYYCMCVLGFAASNGEERFNASQSVTCSGEV
ncbi:hypothetical protein PGIGA_G00138840 [Pangasianodon gigas]|uniref:Uncharacterized protein n=1 Tax=Pangasianodon gigas TaxID=30993 RepID=A0ACC5XL37_PANGG|nr:hypothetical protein [Pangasianodon gigas]